MMNLLSKNFAAAVTAFAVTAAAPVAVSAATVTVDFASPVAYNLGAPFFGNQLLQPNDIVNTSIAFDTGTIINNGGGEESFRVK